MKNLIRKIDNKLFFSFIENAILGKYVFSNNLNYNFDNDKLLIRTPVHIKADYVRQQSYWTYKKFYFVYSGKCTIEPDFGWAVDKRHRLIAESSWNNYLHNVKPSYLKFIFANRKIRTLAKALSLQYAWQNYWHFYNDIIGQLNLADNAGLPFDTPIIIPEALASKKYFKEILALSPELQNRNWVFQKTDELIVVHEMHFFNTFWNHRENFDSVLRYIGFDKKFKNANPGNKKIFIDRNADRGRNIANRDQVIELVLRYGFEVIDCDKLSVSEQIVIFHDASKVIGIHGAGLINMIFRQNYAASLLELIPNGYINPCYYWMCAQYGFNYYSLAGEDVENTGSFSYQKFYINVEELETLISIMA